MFKHGVPQGCGIIVSLLIKNLFACVQLLPDMMKQALVLARRPHIVIATPGRLADHLQSSPDIAIAFKKIKILVSAQNVVYHCKSHHCRWKCLYKL